MTNEETKLASVTTHQSGRLSGLIVIFGLTALIGYCLGVLIYLTYHATSQ